MADLQQLKQIANLLRQDVIRSVYRVKSGHIGGSLSAADMIAALYFHQLRINPSDPSWPDRDRFVLSKGHAAPVLYAALARRGFFPVDDLARLRQIDSHLQGAPNLKTPGVDMSSGPLGQGLSAAVGMALAGRLEKKDFQVYCMLGDGEIQEGQVWEAAMSASKFGLNRLIGILDHNGVQMSGTNDEMMPMGDIREKFRSFGWNTVTIDGHSMEQIVQCLQEGEKNTNAPLIIIMETVKAKGVSFMEGKAAWHGACPNEEQYRQALQELGEVQA